MGRKSLVGRWVNELQAMIPTELWLADTSHLAKDTTQLQMDCTLVPLTVYQRSYRQNPSHPNRENPVTQQYSFGRECVAILLVVDEQVEAFLSARLCLFDSSHVQELV